MKLRKSTVANESIKGGRVVDSELSDAVAASLTDESSKTDWKGIYIMGICSTIQAIQFTLFFTSMWPYLKKLVPSVEETFLGFAITMYSVAQCLTAPGFGYWSNCIEQVKLPIKTGFILMGIGNSLYFFAQGLPVGMITTAISVSRFLVGLGSGSTGVQRAYAGMASTEEDRSTAMSCVTAGVAIGTLVGPALNIIFTFLGEDGIQVLGFGIDMYTAPVLMCLGLNIIAFLLIQFILVEKVLIKDAKVGEDPPILPPVKAIPLLVCILTRFLQVFSQTNIESVGAPYSMLMFSQTRLETVQLTSLSHVAAGVIAASLFLYFIVNKVPKCLSGRKAIMISVVSFWLMYFVTYPFSFNEPIKMMQNGTDVDCNFSRFSWCEGLKTTDKWLFYISYIIIFGVTNTIINVAVTSMYSKFAGKRRQGTLLGIYQMAGSMGRLLAPGVATSLFTLYGPAVVWKAMIVVCSLVLLVWIVFYKIMVPEVENKVKKQDSEKDLFYIKV